MANPGAGEILVLANEELSGRSTIYGWAPWTGRTRTIWQGGGSLSNGAVLTSKACPVTNEAIICVFAAPNSPPKLVAINLRTGHSTTLSDPNMALAAKTFPTTHIMRWRGVTGATVTGVFVAPFGEHGTPPLVITTYNCSGFLQGGTAQVTPEFALARHGIASLCLSLIDRGMWALVQRKKLTPLQLHKYALATLDLVVRNLADRRLIDPTRIGISGQSFSSNVVAYAISHSHLFKAASMGTGITIDPSAYYITAPTRGSWRKDAFSVEGLPPPDDDPAHIWSRESPALNAANIDAALLIQPPESEYLFGLQLYTSIADAGGVVDMFIYPHAGHMLQEQPAQQISRAERSVAWFRYWLNGERDQGNTPAGEMAYWKSLEDQRSINR
jgi:dipeptidyl aminopeptidase/acylaminoacyl peptidase